MSTEGDKFKCQALFYKTDSDCPSSVDSGEE